jgi:integrase
VSGWQYTIADFKPATVAWVIQRVIEDMAAMGRTVGASQSYTLRVIQRLPIGSIKAAELTRTHVIDFAKGLRKTRGPSTVNQYVCFLGGALKHAGAAWDDCKDVSDAAVKAVKPFLKKHNLVSKATPRKRIATQEEIAALISYYSTPNKRGKARILPMLDIMAFAKISTRRIGEICRITHGDVDWDRKDDHGNATPMYMVRDLKHPTKKKGNDKWFPMLPGLAEIIQRQPRMTANPDERIFPYNSKSCSASFTNAKKELDIKGLRFHDFRRLATTYWLSVLKSPHKVKLITGHETTQILERVYDATNPASVHADLRELRA